MPLPPSGNPISLEDLRTEFGDANGGGVSLNEFYRGGGNVPIFAQPGETSFTTAPLTPQSPVPLPTSGSLQLSMFYDTEAVVFGSTGLVTAPAGGINYFRDFTLPAGVRYLRFALVGGGGGGGGANARLGGNGGGGSVLYGTVDTNSFGSFLNDRTLRVFVGKGGQGGPFATGSSTSTPARTTVDHGYPLVPRTFGPWSTWLNTYGVNNDQVIIPGGNSYVGTFTFIRYVYFPTAGVYTFQALADDVISISLNGTNILTSAGSFASPTPTQSTVAVGAGPQRLTFTYTNSPSTGGPGGFGVRIVSSLGAEIWTTRYEQAVAPGANSGFPTGGNGGYAGSTGASGYGGAGGSATWFAIIDGTTFYPIALAGGGGGGGGAGQVGYAYVNGNTRTQHFTRVAIGSTDFRFVGGGEGEYISLPNNGEGFYNPPGTIGTNLGLSDGGGGGGGGGGLQNDRIYSVNPAYQFKYSGMGGKRSHFNPSADTDGDAEGGESGRSWLHPSATTYADFIHRVTTGRTPNFPTSLPVGAAALTSYGIGGERSVTQDSSGFTGTNGAAYFDWGYTNDTAAAVSASTSPLQSSVFPFNIYRQVETFQGMTFIADAWGGGGTPGTSGYTFSWQYDSGDAVSFSSPSTARTTITTGVADLAAPVRSGVVRCVVSDGTSTHTSFIAWELRLSSLGGGGDGGGFGP